MAFNVSTSKFQVTIDMRTMDDGAQARFALVSFHIPIGRLFTTTKRTIHFELRSDSSHDERILPHTRQLTLCARFLELCAALTDDSVAAVVREELGTWLHAHCTCHLIHLF